MCKLPGFNGLPKIGSWGNSPSESLSTDIPLAEDLATEITDSYNGVLTPLGEAQDNWISCGIGTLTKGACPGAPSTIVPNTPRPK